MTKEEAKDKALALAVENATHETYCNAIHGPDHETWLVEKDCNCWLKEFRTLVTYIQS